MAKARSLTGRTELVRRWKVRVDGQVEDAKGNIYKELPIEIAYSPQAVELARQGVLEIEGIFTPISPAPESKETPEVEKTPPPPLKLNKGKKG